MKLVRYLSDGVSARLGLLIDDRVVPLADVAPGAPTAEIRAAAANFCGSLSSTLNAKRESRTASLRSNWGSVA